MIRNWLRGMLGNVIKMFLHTATWSETSLSNLSYPAPFCTYSTDIFQCGTRTHIDTTACIFPNIPYICRWEHSYCIHIIHIEHHAYPYTFILIDVCTYIWHTQTHTRIVNFKTVALFCTAHCWHFLVSKTSLHWNGTFPSTWNYQTEQNVPQALEI